MLVITRKKGESLMIGDDIEVTITKIEDGSVKIGIKAPKNVNILRKELLEEIQKENEIASNINLKLLKNIRKKK